MDYAAFLSGFEAHARLGRISRYGVVHEGVRDYPLLRFELPGPRSLWITAGFHGEEPGGPLTLLHHLPELVDHARSLGIGLQVFPCINPSGFEDGTRYNRSGEEPNNDFLRYELADGSVVDELPPGSDFRRWIPFDGSPKETRALRDALAPMPLPVAALDLHQDRYFEAPGSYAFTFGSTTPYLPMVAATRAIVPLIAETVVDEPYRTDADGLCVAHDGSVSDWLLRRGVPHPVTLETTTATPFDAVARVNLVWCRGLAELVAATPAERPAGR